MGHILELALSLRARMQEAPQAGPRVKELAPGKLESGRRVSPDAMTRGRRDDRLGGGSVMSTSSRRPRAWLPASSVLCSSPSCSSTCCRRWASPGGWKELSRGVERRESQPDFRLACRGRGRRRGDLRHARSRLLAHGTTLGPPGEHRRADRVLAAGDRDPEPVEQVGRSGSRRAASDRRFRSRTVAPTAARGPSAAASDHAHTHHSLSSTGPDAG